MHLCLMESHQNSSLSFLLQDVFTQGSIRNPGIESYEVIDAQCSKVFPSHLLYPGSQLCAAQFIKIVVCGLLPYEIF